MQVFDVLEIKSAPKKIIEKMFGSRKERISIAERRKRIHELYEENKVIYKRAKETGFASEKDKNRHREILEELMRLKAF